MNLQRIFLIAASALTLSFAASAQTISYPGGTISQNFDGMGATGTNTPSGWFVASNNVANGTIAYGTNVTVNAGATGPGAAIRGYNLGTSNATDRALGTGPTGVNRYMEARIRNNAGQSLHAITVAYEGEEWRTGSSTTTTNTLVLEYSADGTNYTAMGGNFNFIQPTLTPVSVALDGNAAANRVTGIGGTYTLPTAAAPNSTVFLRWFDFNDGGTDPLLGVDEFSFSATLTNEPPTIALTSPTNGQTFLFSANVPVAAAGSGTITNVAFFVDGNQVTMDATAPYTGTLPFTSLPIGTRTLVAVALDGAGNPTTSASVTIEIIADQPPTITITNTFSGAVTGPVFPVGSSITVQASVTDDVAVTNVDWYVDNVFHIRRTAQPFSFVYNDSLAGIHGIHGIATDRAGVPATSATLMVTVTNPPGNYTLLVTNGSDWKYFATSNEPAVDGSSLAWFQSDYDDAGWSNGLAELGGGDAAEYPETTVIPIGPTGNRFRAVYFRKVFQVDEASLFANLVINLLRDDGAVVYINGTAVMTNNIPSAATNAVVYSTAAAAAADDGTIYQVLNINPAILANGPNTVAVEVHQQNATSSDVSFDLMLWGEEATLPFVAITSPAGGASFIESTPVTVNVNATTFVTNVNFLVDGVSAGDDGTRPFSLALSNLAVGSRTLTAVGADQFGNNATSAPVTITITANQLPVIAITNVVNGTNTSLTYLVGTSLTCQYSVSDDLGVTNVDFLVDGALHLRKASGFGTLIVNDTLAGVHTLQAVATDTLGASTASAIVTVTITNPPLSLLLTNGADWRYNDDGVTQAVDWVTLTFDDSSWSNGLAELGFGDIAQNNPERTLVRRNSGLATNNVIYYFRKIIEVADPSIYTNLVVSLLRDDGGRVFLNGNAVFTSPGTYPPTGAVADDGTVYFSANVNPTNLVAGSNIVAVEIRQDNAGSSDISFDLMIWGAEDLSGPELFITTDGINVTVTWTGSGYKLQQNTDPGEPTTWVDVAGDPQNLHQVVLPPGDPILFYRLKSVP